MWHINNAVLVVNVPAFTKTAEVLNTQQLTGYFLMIIYSRVDASIYWLGYMWQTGVGFPAGAEKGTFSSPPRPDLSRSPFVFYPMGTEGSFFGDKVVGTWNWPLMELYTHFLHIFMEQRLVKPNGKFSFNYFVQFLEWSIKDNWLHKPYWGHF